MIWVFAKALCKCLLRDEELHSTSNSKNKWMLAIDKQKLIMEEAGERPKWGNPNFPPLDAN